MLNPVPNSKFSEFSHCDDHFAIAPQKTAVFQQKLTIDSLSNSKHMQKNMKFLQKKYYLGTISGQVWHNLGTIWG